MKIIRDLLPYNENLELRNTNSLELIVIHCTELPTLALAREFGEKVLYRDSRTGNSGHYYIDRDGKILQYVEDNRKARHVIGHNGDSIGIEIVNSGRYPNWFHAANQIPVELYLPEQIDSVKKLLRHLKQTYPHISRIARHSDLDVQEILAEDDPAIQIRRKIDPGPLFPWEEILAFWTGICAK
jgi:N-acetylmuramoyl-L-alanine amidase